MSGDNTSFDIFYKYCPDFLRVREVVEVQSMTSQVQFSYENMGASSYLAAAFSPQAGVVNYQLEMLAANEIRHFLPVTKRIVDGEIRVYYNISSKIALNQILGRRKLSKNELLQLLNGFLSAAEDGEQYQLPAGGLLLEPDYIFMDPSGMEPSFVYLPVSQPQEKGVKELVFSLVMEGKIELTGDNFVQLLLEAVNQQPFKLEYLKQAVSSMSGSGKQSAGAFAGSAAIAGTSGVFQQGAAPQPAIQQPGAGFSQSAAGFPQGGMVQPAQGVGQPEPGNQPAAQQAGTGFGQPASGFGKPAVQQPDPVSKPAKGSPASKGKKKEKVKPAAAETSVTAEDDEFDAEKAKKKFVLPQAVIMVAVSAMVSFGAFTDEFGNIAIKNILAVVLVLAVTEVILYREAYVNSRKKGSKSPEAQKKAAKKKAGTKPSAPSGFGSRGGAGSKPSVPSGFGSGASAAAAKPQVSSGFGNGAGAAGAKPSVLSRFGSGAGQLAQGFGQQPVQHAQVSNPMPQAPQLSAAFSVPPAAASVPSYAGMASSSGSGDETELWDGSQSGMRAYLEYYENGQLTRIPLDKPSILIGRLKGQVDFAVANPKVGKIHAEFLNQNGLIYVKDLNSKNGTYINGSGQRIGNNVPYPLSNNDRITLADSEFTLHCGS